MSSEERKNPVDDDDGAPPEKKSRKRIKRQLTSIKDQMEFYFGDSNLNRDRFMWNLIQQTKDGYIELDFFKNFNKMKTLSTDANIIAKAISNSTLLELDEDGLRVRRKTPVPEPVGLDERTVYIEHLPSNANHTWIKDNFSHYGQINYISLPKFKHSGFIKGFSFIEFESPHSALKACEHFGAKCESLLNYIESNKEVSEDEKIKKDTEVAEDKKIKKDTEENNDSMKVKEVISNNQDHDKPRNIPENDKLKENESMKKRKKHRKRKKKSADVEELDTITLRVMSKLEWKEWRKKYLTLQKAAMSEIKRSLMLIKEEENKHVDSFLEEKPEKIKKAEPIPFIADVIVFASLKEPILDVKSFKNEVKSVAKAMFIDVGFDCNAYIRCSEPSEAQLLIKNKEEIPCIVDARLLKGDEEQQYWKKIIEDQSKKFQNKKQVNKYRGYDKIISKVEKISQHIRFDQLGNILDKVSDP